MVWGETGWKGVEKAREEEVSGGRWEEIRWVSERDGTGQDGVERDGKGGRGADGMDLGGIGKHAAGSDGT